MVKIFLILALSAITLLAEDKHSCSILTPAKVLASQWQLENFAGKDYKGTLAITGNIILTRIPPAGSPLDPPNPLPTKAAVKWEVDRGDLTDMRMAFAKFSEWSSVAKKNRIQTLSKQISENQSYGASSFTFEVRNGKCSCTVHHRITSFSLNDEDMNLIISLLGKLPKLDAAILAPKTEKNDALFK